MASFCAAVGWVGYSRFSAIFVCGWFLACCALGSSGVPLAVRFCRIFVGFRRTFFWFLPSEFRFCPSEFRFCPLFLVQLPIYRCVFCRGARLCWVVVVLLSGSCFVFFFRGVNVCSMACWMACSISSGLFLSLIEIRQSRVLYSLLSFRSAASSWAVTIWRLSCHL